MSGEERERGFLVRQAVEGRLSQREASERLGVSVRQFQRLVRAWRAGGDAGLISRQRGRPSHLRLSEAVCTRICRLLKDKYPDFGATLATEKLAELDQIKVSAETVRLPQIGLEFWRPTKRRAKRVFQLRERRPRFTGVLKDAGIRISMDGRGRCLDNVFIERLWRSLKYECVYLHVIETGSEPRAGVTKWIDLYNGRRPHSAHADRTPNEAYGLVQSLSCPGPTGDPATTRLAA